MYTSEKTRIRIRYTAQAVLTAAIISCGGLLQAQTNPSLPGGPQGTQPRGRNVLLLVADDVGAETLVGYVKYKGSITNPSTVPAENIQKIAKAGVTFTNAWAHPTCSPTRAALLTGLYAHRVKILKPESLPATLTLPSDVKLLPAAVPSEVATGHFGKWHISKTGADPVAHGFDRFVGFVGGGVASYKKWDKYDSATGLTTPVVDYTTSYFVDQTLSWIKELEPTGKQWFAMVAFNAAHATEEKGKDEWKVDDLSKQCVIVPTEATKPRRVYELQIRCLDAEIGRLLGGLAAMRTRPLDNTTIIFIGDNGTPGQVIEEPITDSLRAKGSVYQGGVHVPFIIADGRHLMRDPPPIPGTPPASPQLGSVNDPGRDVGSPVHVVDLYPTIREVLSGVGSTSAGDGVSLCPFLGGKAAPPITRKAIMTGDDEAIAATDGRMKLIKTSDGKIIEFYDLESDPFEAHNLQSTIGTPLSTPARDAAYKALDEFLSSFGL